jgi:hypothetical protein
LCRNPFVTRGAQGTCGDAANTAGVPCLYCREPALIGFPGDEPGGVSSCTDNTQCCGLCVQNGAGLGPDGGGWPLADNTIPPKICQSGVEGSPCHPVDSLSLSAECFSGVCDHGSCTAPPAVGSACATTDNCPGGVVLTDAQGKTLWYAFSCAQVAKVARPFHTLTNFCCLSLDSPCSTDADCCSSGGDTACVEGTCKARGGLGATCGKDFDCDNFHTCIAGTCQAKSGLNGDCDSDADCCDISQFPAGVECGVVYQCSPAGTCKAPNGASCPAGPGVCIGGTNSGNACNTDTDCPGTTAGYPPVPPGKCGQPDSCALGACVQCSYGTICGNCCTTPVDETFCGDQTTKICCNNQCVPFVSDTDCGACGIDCTCGGTDPNRFCGGILLDSQGNPSYAACLGTYSQTSGHCAASDTSNLSISQAVCASGSECPINGPILGCDCSGSAGTLSLFCFAGCQGSFPWLAVDHSCAKTGAICLGSGYDGSCCSATDSCQDVGLCGVSGNACFSDYSTCQ